jgi:hypothetical protein
VVRVTKATTALLVVENSAVVTFFTNQFVPTFTPFQDSRLPPRCKFSLLCSASCLPIFRYTAFRYHLCLIPRRANSLSILPLDSSRLIQCSSLAHGVFFKPFLQRDQFYLCPKHFILTKLVLKNVWGRYWAVLCNCYFRNAGYPAADFRKIGTTAIYITLYVI